jgi:DNA polymerase III alpha subunit
MAFIEASDETGIVNNGVIFPDYWTEYKNMVVEGNCLLLCGKRSEDRSRDSFIIELIEQM